MDKCVIVVAGGRGTRIGRDIPKQFIAVREKPILSYTIDLFRKYDKEIEIILVLPSDQIEEWYKVCSKYGVEIDYKIVAGGAERFNSVLNGLNEIKYDQALVAVHDGVRPLVSIETIKRTFESAESCKAAIPVIPVVDSLRELEKGAVDRAKFVAVQTPQVFELEILRKGYSQPFSSKFTDDASVVESLGIEVTCVDGDTNNIKITHERDLIIMDLILAENDSRASSS